MTDHASHPDPEVERVVQHLFRNVGVPNIGTGRPFTVHDLFAEICAQFGIEAARQVHIKITLH